jgi:hypothetical protein
MPQQSLLLLHLRYCCSKGWREYQSKSASCSRSKVNSSSIKDFEISHHSENPKFKFPYYPSEVKVVFDFNASAIALAPSSEILLFQRLERISIKKCIMLKGVK